MSCCSDASRGLCAVGDGADCAQLCVDQRTAVCEYQRPHLSAPDLKLSAQDCAHTHIYTHTHPAFTRLSFVYHGKTRANVSCPASCWHRGRPAAAHPHQPRAGHFYHSAQPGRAQLLVQQHLLPAVQSPVRARRAPVEPSSEEEDET